MRFLLYERKCQAVLFERNPRTMTGQPDVLGVNVNRYLYEIELKISISDLRANADKRHVTNRDQYLPLWPRRFWFMVPPSIADRAPRFVPDYAGLLVCESHRITVPKEAPINHASKRLSVRESVRLFHCLANQVVAQQHALELCSDRWASNHWDQDYEI